jgi:hypothetical protein
MKMIGKSGAGVLVLFAPFLLLYLAISGFFAPGEFVGDEGRYVLFARNLLSGFYSPPPPEINLWNGPGYPLFIAFFLLFKLPLMCVRLGNAVLLYLSLVVFFKTVNLFVSRRAAFVVSSLLGFYYPVYKMLPLIYSECLAWFLISLACFTLIKSFEEKFLFGKYAFFASICVAALAMTKVAFGYVIVVMTAGALAWYAASRRREAVRAILIFSLSFILCLPWLFYTFKITGKAFFWANSGALSLYTMSTPFEGELGDWKIEEELLENPNHREFIQSITKLDPVEKCEAYRKAALKNIANHPKKYLANWLANIGRMLFSFPFSDTDQSIRTFFTLIPNMFVVVLGALALVAGFVYRKFLSPAIGILVLFFLVYLFGSSLLSAYRRMFYITLPFWGVYVSFIFFRVFPELRQDPGTCKSNE